MLNIESIFYIKCSVVGLNGAMILNENHPMQFGGMINRSRIELPGFVVNDTNIEDVRNQIKNTLWQCGGISKSPNKE